MNVDKLTALVKKEGITYDEKGEVMEYLQSVINKEWVAFEKKILSLSKRWRRCSMDYRMPLYIQLQDSIIKKIDEKNICRVKQYQVREKWRKPMV